jgi:hypothetical protein
LGKRLSKAGLPIGLGVRYRIRQIVDAISSEADREKFLMLRFRREESQRKLAILERNLVPLAEVEAMLEHFKNAIRECVRGLPDIAGVVNPKAPELAKKELQRRTAALLRMLK